MKTVVAGSVAVLLAAGLGTGSIYTYRFSPAAGLRSALRVQPPKSGGGMWGYPSTFVTAAMGRFGADSTLAFPILKQAVGDADPEVREQAVAAMGVILRSAGSNAPRNPATNVVFFLREIALANGDLSFSAMGSIEGRLQARDLPLLADLLVRSHGQQSPPKARTRLQEDEEAKKHLNNVETNEFLQRFLPNAIAGVIERDPAAASPFLSTLEALLDDPNPDIRLEAACALAKYKGLDDRKISGELEAALKDRHTSRPYPGREERNQRMAIDTLFFMGPAAKPLLPLLLDYAGSIGNESNRHLAYRTAGKIDSSLRSTVPGVDEALKLDPIY